MPVSRTRIALNQAEQWNSHETILKPFAGLKTASRASRDIWEYTQQKAHNLKLPLLTSFLCTGPPKQKVTQESPQSETCPATFFPVYHPSKHPVHRRETDPFVLENPVTSVTTFFHSFPSIIFFLPHHCILFFTFTKLIRNICDNCDKNPGSRINRTFRTCHRSRVICDRGFSKKSY